MAYSATKRKYTGGYSALRRPESVQEAKGELCMALVLTRVFLKV
jgi:hypothetical protein